MPTHLPDSQPLLEGRLPYVKLDCGILDSTIWLHDAKTRVCWITLLAMADSSGMVEATAPGIAHRACLDLESTRKAIEIFESPDPDSKTGDGRRIERIDGGYLVINYDKYRSKDHTAAERKRRQRSRESNQQHTDVSRVTSVTNEECHDKQKHSSTVFPKEGNTVQSKPNGFDKDAFAVEVFGYYVPKIGRDPVLYTLTPKRKSMLFRRMREVWSQLAEPKRDSAIKLCQYAIDMMAKSPYHNGQNEQGQKYLEWELIFRSQEKFQWWLNRK